MSGRSAAQRSLQARLAAHAMHARYTAADTTVAFAQEHTMKLWQRPTSARQTGRLR
ncbi:MAG: hypothetical protein ACRDYX_11495 [Egibacteraceae bacterium]